MTTTPDTPVQTLSALVDELVARGWARKENLSPSTPCAPGCGAWDVADVLTDKNQPSLELRGIFTTAEHGTTLFEVHKCHCCDRIADTTVVNETGGDLAWLRGWVGLEMVAQVSTAVLAARRAQMEIEP